MLSHNTLSPNDGARKTSKRLWRWDSSGKGSFSGRGCKGQNARQGGGVPAWFEWGQTPLFRRMPKNRGFKNFLFKDTYNVINLDTLQELADAGITTISSEILLEKKVLRRKGLLLKVLGNGAISKAITIKADKFSIAAKEAIEKAGGTVEIISL